MRVIVWHVDRVDLADSRIQETAMLSGGLGAAVFLTHAGSEQPVEALHLCYFIAREAAISFSRLTGGSPDLSIASKIA